MWKAETDMEGTDECIRFSLHSPDQDQGYPADLDIAVIYTLTSNNELMIEYIGTSEEDTIVNMTNHSYFNLSGEGSGTAMNQYVTILADAYTHTDEGSIPDGILVPVDGTVMDFREEKQIGRDIDSDYPDLAAPGGFDHNWALNGYGSGSPELAATLRDEESGIKMSVLTDLPGIQFYAGNFLAGESMGKCKKPYGKREGVCFESQFFPNAINIPNFVSPVLKAGDTYHTITVYRFETV